MKHDERVLMTGNKIERQEEEVVYKLLLYATGIVGTVMSFVRAYTF